MVKNTPSKKHFHFKPQTGIPKRGNEFNETQVPKLQSHSHTKVKLVSLLERSSQNVVN